MFATFSRQPSSAGRLTSCIDHSTTKDTKSTKEETNEFQESFLCALCAFVVYPRFARADWPALIKAHQEAMDEIDTLRGAMAADDERLRKAGERVGIDQGCDTAEWMADEIERLRADVAARMPDPVPANDPELHELYDVWKGQR